jgi:hypothetical protein
MCCTYIAKCMTCWSAQIPPALNFSTACTHRYTKPAFSATHNKTDEAFVPRRVDSVLRCVNGHIYLRSAAAVQCLQAEQHRVYVDRGKIPAVCESCTLIVVISEHYVCGHNTRGVGSLLRTQVRICEYASNLAMNSRCTPRFFDVCLTNDQMPVHTSCSIYFLKSSNMKA